jgi:acyl-CoA synthetase (AMP-forming)/AMP-acid ligase II
MPPATALPATCREAARRFGDRTAYVTDGGWSLTYTELDRVSDEVAAGLAARGLHEGEVLALVLPPGVEYVVAYLAAAKLGAITAGVNDRLTRVEREAVLERAGPRLVLAAPGALPEGPPTVEVAVAGGPDALLREVRIADAAPPPIGPDPERAVAIVFTSGTTGTPKGALYCERQLAFITATDVGDAWGAGGRGFSGTSLAHLGFMTKLPGALRRGGTTFVMRRWRAEAALELLERERLTSVAGVPSQLALMLRHPRFDELDLTSVQTVITGGGPITPALAQEVRARFHARLATRYSCTEAGIGLGTSFDDPEEDAVVSVGRPHPSVEVALVDEDDRAVADGEVGQVCLRSPAVMSGYWRDPDATRRAFTADGFVRTGDLAWRDDAGRLRLVGRSTERYVRGGYNVHPVEVEAAISTHPSVAAVAVVPRLDDVMGEIGVAVVVPGDPDRPPTLESLRSHASTSVARYKLPEALVLVDALPLTAGEKVDRRALVEHVQRATVDR